MFASTRPLAFRATMRSPLRTGVKLNAKPFPAGTTPIPLSCPRLTNVTVTSALTNATTERVCNGSRCAAKKMVTGLVKLHIVAPITVPCATAKHVRAWCEPLIRANGCPFASLVPVTTRTELRANPRCAKVAVTASHR